MTKHTPDCECIMCVDKNFPILYCDGCGKRMTDAKGKNIIGCEIKTGELSELGRGFLQCQIGPYKLGKIYRACYECFLKCMGLKP